ncbi:hypothetical protein SDC9_12294 [bioreactor metagenome]|jgi:hypothetical protein|uniref:Uncharacterized protein n=1 Tax=bioreactor metagenome TaxID=1076179 RepID=A0A644TJK9_9ZZZZ
MQFFPQLLILYLIVPKRLSYVLLIGLPLAKQVNDFVALQNKEISNKGKQYLQNKKLI